MSITSQINTTGYKCEIIRQTGTEDLLVNLLEIENINDSLVYDDNMYQSFAELESEINTNKIKYQPRTIISYTLKQFLREKIQLFIDNENYKRLCVYYPLTNTNVYIRKYCDSITKYIEQQYNGNE